MANEPLNETAPGSAENRETTTPSPAASSTVAKPAKAGPAGRKKAAAKARPRSTTKRSKAPAERSASGTRPLRQASLPVAAPAAALPRATAGRTGIGITVADLVESNARSYVSAQEQIAAAARGTWLASVAKLNARVITQVAEAQADLARRLLG
jgi:hypothetical protein